MERPESLPLLGFRRGVKQHVCPISSPVVIYHSGDSLVCLDTCEAYAHAHICGPLSGPLRALPSLAPLVAVPFEYPLGTPLSLLGDTRL